MKNYYKILGVLDDAEDIIIRAAYKALAQTYHPDKWIGDPQIANQRMSDINEAYATLSDELKRKQYDQEYFKFNSRNDAENATDLESDDIQNEEVEGWQLAIEFFPIIKNQYDELRKISNILANTFRTVLIENKDYKNSKIIKEKYEKDYLIRFYGEDESVRIFAKRLLTEGHSRAAMRLNKILRLMGNSVDLKDIAKKLHQEFPEISKNEGKFQSNKNIQQSIIAVRKGNYNNQDLIQVVEHFYKTNISRELGILNEFYSLKINGNEYIKIGYSELAALARKAINNNR